MFKYHPHRARTSDEFLAALLFFFIAPSSQELEPPVNPGRFSVCIRFFSNLTWVRMRDHEKS